MNTINNAKPVARQGQQKNTGGIDFVSRNHPQDHGSGERGIGVSNLGIETTHNFARIH
jgi:hypothetical protein